ncbi:glycosyltransferase [Algoriphagus namhaensis]|uniref:Glycosyltransferase n=1 Tax=Algoriphagus namhaensis TaxID=915353 RepID=A0ABV8AQJ6_9BACT
MKLILLSLLALPFFYLFASALYQLILALASKRHQKAAIQPENELPICVVVPCYQSDETILSATEYNLNLIQKSNHPVDLLVVGDGLQKETIVQLKELGAKVLEVAFEKSTKVKALQSAVAYLREHRVYDSVLVLDADNLLVEGFDRAISHFRERGVTSLQGERLPMNQDTTMALLDGLSEKANQEMLCKGANALGLSSKLTGSAMAFEFWLFTEMIPQLNAVGGFDKELELLLTSKGTFIQYSPDLMVLDEKVRGAADFEKQRGRWLESQYAFLRKSILPALFAAAKGNVDYLHKSLQLALPPRVLAPVAWFALIVISLLSGFDTLALLSVLGLTILMSSYLLVIPFHWWSGKVMSILKALPGLFFSGFKSLLWMKKAKTQFLHTQHQAVQS